MNKLDELDSITQAYLAQKDAKYEKTGEKID